MKTLLTACFLLLSAACGGSESAGCAFPDKAVFEAQFTERAGGTCGPIDSSNITSSGTGDTQSSCFIPDWIVDDMGCTRSRAYTCVFGAETVIATESLSYVSNDDWAGTYSSHVSGPSVCSSIYDLVLVRR